MLGSRKLGVPVVVAVGGSDPSAGAGIQADLRSLEACGVLPATVVTAITVQAGRGLKRMRPVEPRLVVEQLRELRRAMVPAAVKTGALPTAACVTGLVRELAVWRVPIVVDPVTEASGGGRLASRNALRAMSRELFPLASLLTVNLAEASALLDRPVTGLADMKEAAGELARFGSDAVLVKGGHLKGQPADVLWDGQALVVYRGSRIRGPDMHGNGCALASAVAAGLARGMTLRRAVAMARRHLRGLLGRALPLDARRSLRGPAASRGH